MHAIRGSVEQHASIGGVSFWHFDEFEFKTSFLSFLEPEKNEKGTTKSV